MITATVRPDKPTWFTLTKDGRFYGSGWRDTAEQAEQAAEQINRTQRVPKDLQTMTVDDTPLVRLAGSR